MRRARAQPLRRRGGRATALGFEVVQPPHVNEAPNHREIWLRDPDEYVVVFCSPDGEAGGWG